MPKIEKYTKRFKLENDSLSLTREQHMFHQLSLCQELFKQWGKYDVEHAYVEMTSSPKE
jgi:hypothetical protein